MNKPKAIIIVLLLFVLAAVVSTGLSVKGRKCEYSHSVSARRRCAE